MTPARKSGSIDPHPGDEHKGDAHNNELWFSSSDDRDSVTGLARVDLQRYGEEDVRLSILVDEERTRQEKELEMRASALPRP